MYIPPPIPNTLFEGFARALAISSIPRDLTINPIVSALIGTTTNVSSKIGSSLSDPETYTGAFREGIDGFRNNDNVLKSGTKFVAGIGSGAIGAVLAGSIVAGPFGFVAAVVGSLTGSIVTDFLVDKAWE